MEYVIAGAIENNFLKIFAYLISKCLRENANLKQLTTFRESQISEHVLISETPEAQSNNVSLKD